MKEKLLTILEIFIVLTFFTLAAIMATENKKNNRMMAIQNCCTRCKDGYYQYQQYKNFEFYTCNECGYAISLK